jgi:hypothetical protein
MKKISILSLAAFAAIVLTLAGCNTEREQGRNKAVLKGGQQVSADMVGWVAVPNTVPEVKQAGGVSYAVLGTHNVIPTNMDGWVATNGAFFTKLSGVQVDAPKGSSSERWVLKPEGKSVPKDKHGWVAVPFSEPQIESSAHKKDREMAALIENNIVPKEMNGWVAVDRDTLAKLVEKFMQTGTGSKVSKE